MITRKDVTLTVPRFSLCAAAVVLSTSVLAAAPVAAQAYQQPADAQNRPQGTSATPGAATSTPSPSGMSRQNSSGQQASNQSNASLTDRLPDRYQLSNWMGKTVRNSAGEKLGTVEELVMDDVGLLRYVILKSDLLTDNKEGNLVAIPVGHFEFPLARKDHLVLEVSSGRMKGAPAFSENRDMPDVGRPEISSVIVAYWVPDDAANTKQGQATSAQGQASANQGQTAGMGDSGQQQNAVSGYSGNRDMIKLSERKNELFEKLDENNSGAIEKSEAQGHTELSERFSEADTYGNGAITRSEFAAFELKDDSADPNKGKTADQYQGQQDSSVR